MPDTSRAQLFFIGVDEFVRLIGGWGEKFMRPVCKTLPADAKVEAVTYDFERHSFAMRVTHPSFAPVECGAPIPWGGRIKVEWREAAASDVLEKVKTWSMAEWKKLLDEIAREKGVSVRDMLKNGRDAVCDAQPAEYAGANGIGKWVKQDGFYCSPVPIGDLPPKMAYTSVVVNPERGEQVGEVGRAQAADTPAISVEQFRRLAQTHRPPQSWYDDAEDLFGADGAPVTPTSDTSDPGNPFYRDKREW